MYSPAVKDDVFFNGEEEVEINLSLLMGGGGFSSPAFDESEPPAGEKEPNG